jgi:hypothetical protein
MRSQPRSKVENKAIDDVVRAWRSWARERGISPDQPSGFDLHVFAHHLAQQTGPNGRLPLPGLGAEDYSQRILKALALRGFLPPQSF